jgi:hypothetical protein
LKKRTKKLLSICAGARSVCPVQMDESLFASFSSEKEDLPSYPDHRLKAPR